ncbi:MAG: ArnT family glycosyltransferase [Verrucomicrobiales bacterium]
MSLRNFFSDSKEELSGALILRRLLFLLLLFGLMLFYLGPGFKQLTSPKGIEQAQIARELARSGSFQTKMIRPLSLYQADENTEDPEGVKIVGFKDTYHAPLNPILNSVIIRLFKGDNDFGWDNNSTVYYLDRIITATSIFFLLASIGVTFLFISRIFDAKIGGVTALLMLLCELLWRYSQSGLPQMLMLFLFTLGCYFVYRAVEAQCLEKKPLALLILGTVCFGLLALTHWMALWPFIGLVIFSCFYFKPRGAAGLSMLIVFLIIILPWCLRNLNTAGDILGSGYFSMFGGMGAAEEEVFRSYNLSKDNIFRKGFASKVLTSSLYQLNGIYSFLGSIIAAPLFFLALLHPFKRPQIAAFKWFVLAMWVPAVIGMSLFGVSNQSSGISGPDANQIHLLFIPLMTAYGLAMLAILWSRIGLSSNIPIISENGYLWIAIGLSTIPMVLSLLPGVTRGIQSKEKATRGVVISYFGKQMNKTDIVITDSPWEVAWYGDRTALWLPTTKADLREIMKRTKEHKNPFSGILITPRSMTKSLLNLTYREEKEWAPIIVGQTVASAGTGTDPTQPKSWLKDGLNIIESLEGLPFKKVDPKLTTSGYFFLVDPDQ